MPEVYIIAAVRTPLILDANSRHASLSAIEMSATVLNEVMHRGRVKPESIDDVVWACADTDGIDSVAAIRLAMQQSGMPAQTPAMVVGRHNAAGHQAVHSAAQAILAGDEELVIAGGVDILPIAKTQTDIPDHWLAHPQPGLHAEQLAEKWGMTRSSLDNYVLMSIERYQQAKKLDYLKSQVVALNPSIGDSLTTDQPLPQSWDKESLANVQPIDRDSDMITSAQMSQPAAGAAALLLASARAVGRLNLTPMAQMVSRAAAAVDFSLGLAGSIPATAQAIKRAGLTLADFEIVLIEEISASAVLAWIERWQPDCDRVNPHGGALAQGRLFISGGGLLITRLIYTLGLTKGRFGLAVSSTPDGMGLATVVERL